MKRILSVFLVLSLMLCGCRRLSDGEGGETEPDFSVEYASDAETEDTLRVVCLDAGHGFGDVGCTSDYLGKYEYEVTLDVVERIQAKIESLGIKVILTHDGATYPAEAQLISDLKRLGIDYKSDGIKENEIYSAYERAMYEEILVREQSVDFFMSIHVNSVEHADYVDGYELYYCNSNPHASRISQFGGRLASVLDNEIKTVGYDYEDAYIVTKYARIPSMLLEIGYATNPEDARKMNDDEWKDALAEILAREIVSYIEK